jgi:di/tricarboxylate transporter
VVGAAFARPVAAAFASAIGGALLVVGFAAAFGAHPLVRDVAARPFALAALALVLAIAGAAFQLSRPEPERGGAPPLRPPDDRRF